MLTKEQAELLVEMHDVEMVLEDGEEHELMEQHNPELLAAYQALKAVADQ